MKSTDCDYGHKVGDWVRFKKGLSWARKYPGIYQIYEINEEFVQIMILDCQQKSLNYPENDGSFFAHQLEPAKPRLFQFLESV
jgi:hypothetical protein